MTTNHRLTTEQLPDLPGLESVEAGVSQRLIAMGGLLICVGVIAGMCIYAFWLLLPFMGEMLVPATVGVGLLALLVLWIIVRLALGVYSWKTDERGLTMRGPIIRRFVAWGDVEDAWSGQGTSDLFYHLQTNGGAIHVNVESRRDAPGLYASIRQHLRRLGRAGSLDLSENALSLWDVIPDEIPNTIHWTNPRPPKLWATIIPMLALVAFLGWGAWVLFSDGNWFMRGVMLIMAAGFVPFVRAVLRDGLQAARSVSLTDDRIEGQTARGTVILPWSEVASARWVRNANSGLASLLISGRDATGRLSVPFISSSEDSGRVILAIIRRLRTHGTPQALTIPEELRAQAGPARIEPQDSRSVALLTEPVEVRLTIRERMLIMFFPAFAGLAIVLGHLPDESMRPALVSVPIAIGLLVATWFASGTYVVRADTEGIRKRLLGFGTLIRWDDIAEYSICPVFKRAVRNHRVLKNSNGKVLTELSLGFGAREARDRFWSILDARLSQSRVSTKPAEPWKSRPWTPS